MRVKHEENDHVMLQEYAPIDPASIRNKEHGRLEVAGSTAPSDCTKFKAENEKITSKYNKAKVHIIEFDSIVNDFSYGHHYTWHK